MIHKKVSEILVEAFLKILRSYSEQFPSPKLSFVKNYEEILKILEINPVPMQALLGIISHESSFTLYLLCFFIKLIRERFSHFIFI